MKTYVLMISRTFPATHPRKGEETGFEAKILNVIKFDSKFVSLDNSPSTKIHTIRGNFKLWEKRIKAIQEGKAILSLRYWSGSPYNFKKDGSKQIEFARLDKDSGIGVQEVVFGCSHIDFPSVPKIDNKNSQSYMLSVENSLISIAKNDGLSLEDFKEWFKGYDLSEPMGIIHFTSFRY